MHFLALYTTSLTTLFLSRKLHEKMQMAMTHYKPQWLDVLFIRKSSVWMILVQHLPCKHLIYLEFHNIIPTFTLYSILVSLDFRFRSPEIQTARCTGHFPKLQNSSQHTKPSSRQLYFWLVSLNCLWEKEDCCAKKLAFLPSELRNSPSHRPHTCMPCALTHLTNTQWQPVICGGSGFYLLISEVWRAAN